MKSWLSTCYRRIRKTEYDFIDIDMPEIDGLELIECLKKHQSFKSVPVIVYTASKFALKFNETDDF